MKKITGGIACALLCLVATSTAWAQETANIAGQWEMTIETPRGTQTSTFTFEQEGTVLTGTMDGQSGATPINSGSVEGNEITFTVVRGMGRGGNMEFTYKGTVDGNTISGSTSTPRGEREFTMRRVEG